MGNAEFRMQNVGATIGRPQAANSRLSVRAEQLDILEFISLIQCNNLVIRISNLGVLRI